MQFSRKAAPSSYSRMHLTLRSFSFRREHMPMVTTARVAVIVSMFRNRLWAVL